MAVEGSELAPLRRAGHSVVGALLRLAWHCGERLVGLRHREQPAPLRDRPVVGNERARRESERGAQREGAWLRERMVESANG